MKTIVIGRPEASLALKMQSVLRIVTAFLVGGSCLLPAVQDETWQYYPAFNFGVRIVVNPCQHSPRPDELRKLG